MSIEQMIERVERTSEQLGTHCARMDVVLSENRTAWMDAGKSEDDCL